MTDDQPTGSCPTCHRRDPRVQQLCDVCRSRLRAWVFDLTDLHAQLSEGEPSVRDYRGTRIVVDDDMKPIDEVPHYDHVSNVLPAGGGPSGFRLGPITGSRERRLPINEDAADLTGPVRAGGLAVLDEDAVGHVSVASVLDFWVEDWRTWRSAGERRPSPTVPEIVRWLLDRLDDAMDHSPSVDEFFHAVRRLYGALKAQLGQVDIPDYKRGVPCRNCLALTLVHQPGSDRIECGSCDALLDFFEYDTHVRSLSAEQVAARRLQVAQTKALRQTLGVMRAAGWRFVSSSESDGWRLCQWFRDDAVVQCWIHPRTGQSPAAVWYHPVAGEGYALSVTTEWIAQEGFPALRKLARSVGLLTPIKQETAA